MQKLKSHSIIVFALVVLISDSLCQEIPLYLNSYLNPFITNAGCTGSEYYPVVNFSVRKTLLGFPDAPATYFLSGNIRLGKRDFYNSKFFLNKGPLKLSDHIGIGAALYHDKNGPLTNTGGLLSYAYHISVSHNDRLSLGFSTLFANYACNSSMLKPGQSSDGYLLNGDENIFKLNFGFGVYYTAKKYFGGISVNKLLPGISNAGERAILKPSYFAMGGYKFNKDNNLINFEPSMEIKKLPDMKLILDIHAKVYLKRLNWMAISISTSKLMNIQFAFRVYKMTYIGYNYGYAMNKMAGYNYGMHEIAIGINLGLTGIEGIREIN